MSPEPNRLLIVDDDPELLRFLIDELSSAGHQCIGCDNGQDALLRWRQERFDLVVLLMEAMQGELRIGDAQGAGADLQLRFRISDPPPAP